MKRILHDTRQDALLTEIRTKAALDKDLEAKLLAAARRVEVHVHRLNDVMIELI